MDEKAEANTVFRRAVRAYSIGAGIALAVTVPSSLGSPLLPLTFAYRLTVLFGGVAAYGAYKRAAAERRLEAARRGDEGVAAAGWATVSYLCPIVVFGSGLLVVATAILFKLITGGEDTGQVQPFAHRRVQTSRLEPRLQPLRQVEGPPFGRRVLRRVPP